MGTHDDEQDGAVRKPVTDADMAALNAVMEGLG